MNHDIGCTDPTVIVQPQLGRRLPVIAQCTGCGAVETRTPTRHRPGEGCKVHTPYCCTPDTIPRPWKRDTPKPPGPRPRPTSTTNSNEDTQ